MDGRLRMDARARGAKRSHHGFMWHHIWIRAPESSRFRYYLARNSCMNTNSSSLEAFVCTSRSRRRRHNNDRKMKRNYVAENSRNMSLSGFETHVESQSAAFQQLSQRYRRAVVMTYQSAVGLIPAFRAHRTHLLVSAIELGLCKCMLI